MQRRGRTASMSASGQGLGGARLAKTQTRPLVSSAQAWQVLRQRPPVPMPNVSHSAFVVQGEHNPSAAQNGRPLSSRTQNPPGLPGQGNGDPVRQLSLLTVQPEAFGARFHFLTPARPCVQIPEQHWPSRSQARLVRRQARASSGASPPPASATPAPSARRSRPRHEFGRDSSSLVQRSKRCPSIMCPFVISFIQQRVNRGRTAP